MSRSHTPKQKAERNDCVYCERKMYDTGAFSRTIDHFYPLREDPALNRDWNKVVCCQRCNKMKAARLPEHFIKYLTKLPVSTRIEFNTDRRHMIINITRLIAEIGPVYLVRDLL